MLIDVGHKERLAHKNAVAAKWTHPRFNVPVLTSHCVITWQPRLCLGQPPRW